MHAAGPGKLMDKRRIVTIYEEYVVAHDLERTALLDYLRSVCTGSPTVLYPGSFVHLTPSFFFQHVVYIDRSDFVRAFFEPIDGVLGVIDDHKRYRSKSYVRFEAQDFTKPLPFHKQSFDVLLALHAPGVTSSCAEYVKPGGLVLTNDHRADARQASVLSGLELTAVLQERGKKVRSLREDSAKILQRAAESESSGRRTKANRVPEAYHYLFRKLR